MTNNGVLTRTEGSIINNTPTTNPTSNSYDIVYNIASDIFTGSEIPLLSTQLRHITKTGGAKLSLSQDIIMNGNLTLSNGVFDASTFNVNLKGNFVANSTSTLTSSTFIFSGATSISGGSAIQFKNVTVTGSLTPTSDIRIDGNLVNNGTLNAGSATTTFGGTTTISGSSTSSFNNINIIVSGTLTAPSGTMNVAGNFANNGSFNHNNGSVTFNGTTTISGSATTGLFGVNITGSLTAPSGTLNIAGDWATTGTFTHNSGKVALNGPVSAQAVTGTVNVNDVDVSNAVGVNINGNMNLYGTLTLVSSGTLDADGSGSGVLTVKSTAVNSGGRIAALSTPTNFSGNVTVERYINSPAGWRYISMPITNGNVASWQANFPVTGNFSNPSPNGVNNVTVSTSPSIYTYDPTNASLWVALGSGASTSATSISNTTGYSVYSYLSNSFTSSVRGTIGKGNISVPLQSGGNGYNWIANPYPSAIDWDNVSLPGSVGSTVYLRIGNNQYASYVHGAGAGTGTNAPSWWSGEIATGQAFSVLSTGSTSLPLTESAKTSNQYQFIRQAAPLDLVRIALVSGDQSDETIIRFQTEATDDTDLRYDAPKMRNGDYFSPLAMSPYINISTYNSLPSSDYAINSIAPIGCPKTVKVKIQDISAADNKLTFSNLNSLDLGYSIFFVDRYLNKQVVVIDGFEYDFKVTADPKSFGDSRFEIQFYPPTISKPIIDVSGEILIVNINVGEQLQWMLNGKLIPGANTSKYAAKESGSYSVLVSNGSCTYSSDNVVLVITGIENSLSNESVKVYPNPTRGVLNVELLSSCDEIRIYDSQGKQVDSVSPPHLPNPNLFQIDISRYQNGLYVLHGSSGSGNFSIKIVKNTNP